MVTIKALGCCCCAHLVSRLTWLATSNVSSFLHQIYPNLRTGYHLMSSSIFAVFSSMPTAEFKAIPRRRSSSRSSRPFTNKMPIVSCGVSGVSKLGKQYTASDPDMRRYVLLRPVSLRKSRMIDLKTKPKSRPGVKKTTTATGSAAQIKTLYANETHLATPDLQHIVPCALLHPRSGTNTQMTWTEK